MNLSKSILLPLGVVLLAGACSPFYNQHPNTQLPTTAPSQQTLTPEQQRILNESNTGVDALGNPVLNPSNMDGQVPPTAPTNPPVPGKKNYPTAAPVPGKEGFVFNPYTHNIVDVKGIASGKLCRDPEDTDQTHKFRVP
jgi:hypothetical protein